MILQNRHNSTNVGAGQYSMVLSGCIAPQSMHARQEAVSRNGIEGRPMLPADQADHAAVAVSAGGGPARHLRVQIQDAPRKSWRCYGTFRRLDSAAECVATLSAQGVRARLVKYAIAPVAG